MHLNGDHVRIFHTPNAHTDGDSVIHFKTANVIHTGDIFFNGFYPFIDVDNGGTVSGVIDAVDQILSLTNADTTNHSRAWAFGITRRLAKLPNHADYSYAAPVPNSSHRA